MLNLFTSANKPSEQQSTNSAKQQVIPSRTSTGGKAKLTTIYTTTDRNGQVFIKRIHENYHELNDDEDEDDEDDCDEDEEDEDDCDEDECEGETDEESNEESEDDEARVVVGADGYEYDCEAQQGSGDVLLRARKSYYDDEYFVDDEDDEEDEDDDEDIGDDDEMDDDLDADEDPNASYYKNNSADQAGEYEQVMTGIIFVCVWF